jgi:hypothetical protein
MEYDHLKPRRPIRFEDIVLLLAFAGELFYPVLSWKLNLPTQLRWVSHFAIVILGAIGLFRSITRSVLPKAILWATGVIVLWGAIAVLWTWQGITATIWGAYILFRYPLLGLYAYTRPNWNKRLSDTLIYLCTTLLIVNLCIQTIQFLTGEIPGDDLAGFFGAAGVGNLVVYIFFVLSLQFGNWIVRGKWLGLLLTFEVGILASVFGEMKVFFVMAIIVSPVALVINILRNRRVASSVIFASCVILGLIGFGSLYNKYVPQADRTSFAYYLDWNNLYTYLNQVVPGNENTYTVGRMTDLVAAWEQIHGNPFNVFFGFGMGSRSASITLGATGAAFSLTDLGVYVGTALATFLGEYGLMGIGLLTILLAWLFSSLNRTESLSSSQQALAVGLAIFTSTLPFWFFYQSYSNLVLSNLLYWVGLGYILKAKSDVRRSHTYWVSPLGNRIGSADFWQK